MRSLKLTLPLSLIILIPVALCLTGCATQFDTKTWVAKDAGDPVKHTRVTHSSWLGLPAVFPGDITIKDRDFVVESKGIEPPSFDFDTLLRRDN